MAPRLFEFWPNQSESLAKYRDVQYLKFKERRWFQPYAQKEVGMKRENELPGRALINIYYDNYRKDPNFDYLFDPNYPNEKTTKPFQNYSNLFVDDNIVKSSEFPIRPFSRVTTFPNNQFL